MTAANVEQAAQNICQLLRTKLASGEGALLGRNGTIELQTLLFHQSFRLNGKSYPPTLPATLELHAGVFPAHADSVDSWALEYLESLRVADVIAAGWYEPLREAEAALLKTHNLHGIRVPLRALEPYYVSSENHWTALLAGQKVAVVSSFARTAIQQTLRAETIWPDGKANTLLPPDVEWVPVSTGYAPALAHGRAEWPAGITKWQEAVDSVVQQVLAKRARIALIGCGGLGMIIGKRLRDAGVIAVVLGGAVQVLFGIKGRRWERHPVISGFWNDAWVWPDVSETPRGSHLIEGGCYWGAKN